MNKSKIFIIIGIVLLLSAGVQFYLAYDAHVSVQMIQNAYEIEDAYDDYEGMIGSKSRMAEEETKSHVFLTSGIVSTVAAVGFFATNAKYNNKESN